MSVWLKVMSDSLRPHILYSPWNSPGQNTGVGSLSLLQEIFPTQGWNPGLLHCGQILYQLSHKGSLRILEWVAYPFSSRSSQPRNRTRVSCTAGRFLTDWAMKAKSSLEIMNLTSFSISYQWHTQGHTVNVRDSLEPRAVHAIDHGCYAAFFFFFFAAPCSLWDLSSPTRDWTLSSESQNPNHQTARQVPILLFLKQNNFSLSQTRGNLTCRIFSVFFFFLIDKLNFKGTSNL